MSNAYSGKENAGKPHCLFFAPDCMPERQSVQDRPIVATC
jgi:hypothetical protein